MAGEHHVTAVLPRPDRHTIDQAVVVARLPDRLLGPLGPAPRIEQVTGMPRPAGDRPPDPRPRRRGVMDHGLTDLNMQAGRFAVALPVQPQAIAPVLNRRRSHRRREYVPDRARVHLTPGERQRVNDLAPKLSLLPGQCQRPGMGLFPARLLLGRGPLDSRASRASLSA